MPLPNLPLFQPFPPPGNAGYSHTYSSGQASNAAAGLRATMPPAPVAFGAPWAGGALPGMPGMPGMAGVPGVMFPGGGMAPAPAAAAPAAPAGHKWRGKYAMLMCDVTLGRIEVGAGWHLFSWPALWLRRCPSLWHQGLLLCRKTLLPALPRTIADPAHIHGLHLIPSIKMGRPGMRITNRGFHAVSNSGTNTVARGFNDIYAVFDNNQVGARGGLSPLEDHSCAITTPRPALLTGSSAMIGAAWPRWRTLQAHLLTMARCPATARRAGVPRLHHPLRHLRPDHSLSTRPHSFSAGTPGPRSGRV